MELWRESLKFDVVKLLDDNGLDSYVDGFTNEVTKLTDMEKERVAEQIVNHIFNRIGGVNG